MIITGPLRLVRIKGGNAKNSGPSLAHSKYQLLAFIVTNPVQLLLGNLEKLLLIFRTNPRLGSLGREGLLNLASPRCPLSWPHEAQQ